MHTEFGKALHINERINTAANISEGQMTNIFEGWCNTINLPIRYQNEYIHSYKMSKEKFVSIINEENKIEPDTSSKMNWYKDVLNIIELLGDETKAEKYLDENSKNHMFFNFTKPIINWVEKIIENTDFDINRKEEKNIAFVRAVIQSCFNIVIENSLKVLIVELRNYGYRNAEESPEFNYKVFVEKLSDRLFFADFVKKYPVMMRSIVEQCKMSLKFYLEINTHLTEDYKLLCNKFAISGDLKSISQNLGDTHCGKKSVVILEFDIGKVVYKPKSLEIDVQFNEILDYLNKKGLKYTICKPRIISKKGYGWQEFIEYLPCQFQENIQELYFKVGVYAALFYVFSASDMHMENLVINGSNPFFIDLESLFQGYQGVPLKEGSAFEKIIQEIRDSVLSTCLFPAHITNQRNCDVSGITGYGGQAVPKGKYEIINKHRSDMMLVRTTYIMKAKKNIAMLDREFVNPRDYSQDIANGFADTYELIFQNKNDFIGRNGLLYRFESVTIRMIVRNTRNYSLLLKATTDPDNLVNAINQDQLFDRLWASLEDDVRLLPIIQSEVSDLRNGDIPYFSSGIFMCDIRDSEGNVYEKFMDTPIALQVIEKIKSMSDMDKNKQLEYIRLAMAEPIKRWELKSNKINYANVVLSNANRTNILFAAKLIEKKLRTNAYYHKQVDDINWVDISISSDAQWSIHPMDGSLYDGILGPAVFYAAFYQVTHDNEYLRLLRKIMKSSDLYIEQYNQTDSLSAFNGYASMAYAYYYVGLVTGEGTFRNKAIGFIKKCEKSICDDKMLDIIGGCAGTLIVALRIYEKERLNEILEIAIKCGKKLIEKSEELPEGIGWRTDIGGGECLAGMSHGCAGMAWALMELYKYTDNNIYKEVAEKAIAYEDSLYQSGDNNWMDMRNRENRTKKGFPEPVHWCHGAAGIGISRSMCYSITQNPCLKRDVDNAIQKTLEDGFGGSDCLCHGTMGSIDMLLIAGEMLQKIEIRKQAEKITYDLVKRAENDQWYSGIPQKFDSMGFMVGLSGIGYELLRVYNPNKVPSALAFFLPEGLNGQS